MARWWRESWLGTSLAFVELGAVGLFAAGVVERVAGSLAPWYLLVAVVLAGISSGVLRAFAQTNNSATPTQAEAVILTPKPSPKPRINNAKVFGVRPDHPFLFTIAATGADMDADTLRGHDDRCRHLCRLPVCCRRACDRRDLVSDAARSRRWRRGRSRHLDPRHSRQRLLRDHLANAEISEPHFKPLISDFGFRI